MPIEEVKVPVLSKPFTGDTTLLTAGGVLLNWQKQPGDTVQEGEKLVDIETDMVVLEIFAPQAGTLAQIIKTNGENVLSEEVIAQIEFGSTTLEPTAEPVTTSTSESITAPTASAEPTSPPVAEPSSEATEETTTSPEPTSPPVSSPEPVAEPSAPPVSSPSTETTVEPAPPSVTEPTVATTPEPSTEATPEPVVVLDVPTPTLTPKPTESIAAAAPTITPTVAVKTSPAVRKMAAEQNIEPSTVQHRGDRVTKADMLQYQVPKTSEVQEPESSEIAEPESSEVQEIAPPVSPLLTNLNKSGHKTHLPELDIEHSAKHAVTTTFNEINMKAVVDLCDKYQERFVKNYGIELGFMSFFTKASVAALHKFPIINASIESDNITYHDDYDIGITVQHGSETLRGADVMSFADIEKSIGNLSKSADDSQLTTENLSGTFSIINNSIFGSMLSIPTLNPSQSAVLGINSIVERPVVENGKIVICPMMYVPLSYNRHFISERDAVQFLIAIKNVIEEPASLLLEI